MNVLISGDATFLPGIELTLTGLGAMTDPCKPIKVALLDAGLDFAAVEKMRQRWCTANLPIELRVLCPEINVWKGFIPPAPPGFPHSPDRLLKPYEWLAALDQLDDWDRVLVIDGDLLCTTDLRDVFMTNLCDCPAAACKDAGHRLTHDCPDSLIREHYGTEPYFNSGVVLIDLLQWRSAESFRAVRAFVSTYGKRLRQEDQTVFNSIFAGRIFPLPRQYNLTHEALGHLETPAGQRLPWEGYVWHLWRQYKPWIAFNPLESGALWYGLHEAWHGQQNPRYHTTRPGYRSTVAKMRQPRLAQLYHRLRGHSEMADYWNARARSGTGRGDWAKRFTIRVDEAAEWWRQKLP